MLLRRLNYPCTTGLILRRTYPELYKSHIVKLFEEYPKTRRWYNEQRKEMIFPNGSRLFFGSAEHEKDMSAFYSAEFADIMPDEAQEFSQHELEQLSGSLRCTSNPNIVPKMIYTFMPGISESGLPPKGLPYLKRVFVDRKLQGEEVRRQWAFVQAFGWDNIEWARRALAADKIGEEEFYSWSAEARREYFITRTEYGATISALSDKALRDAWLDGKWTIFKGQYFTNFSAERHVLSDVVAKDRIKPWHKKWISGDWGYDHPACILWHSQDERGAVITYRELWVREMGESELGKRIGELSTGENIQAFPFSWDAFGKLNKTTRKSITEMIGAAMPGNMPRPCPADATPGSVVSGCRLVHQVLDADHWHIAAACTHLIECLPTLIRDPENTEKVLKVNYSENYIGDDAFDSARYGLQYMLGSSLKPDAVKLEEQIQGIREKFAARVSAEIPGTDWFSQFGGEAAKNRK